MSSSRSFYKNCKRAILTRTAEPSNRACGTRTAGITEAQIVDAVEIDLLQPDC